MLGTRTAAVAFALVATLAPGWAGAQSSDFRVKPSEVPAVGAPGEMRRIIQPFGPWTLICDENLKNRQKVCNVTQQIVDEAGAPVLSLSLAGTRQGAPVMIVRESGPDERAQSVSVAIGKTHPVTVALASCNDAVCIGFLPIDAVLRKALSRGGTAEITLKRHGRMVRIAAPLDDLMAAIKAVK